ncbi:Maleylacetoacetate isomerase [Pseudomonas syringae pv. philadelphi]|uniref:Maleylacetoacetate isomerase n=1 Tax=Pseudomonas syringae pv. philadelphi TaxID=251706 RepID=A0A3M3YMQ9_9PSED|nr:glutathione S-transferase N-terminal domain-containing protein [Pseudomonas syringae group genomosp. 3]RMO83511.1 Maleylacetoacetate isomerase [Pseudomonas syringae pv. philadelphi]
MDLFTYHRSTFSHRVRIALALKGLDYTALPVSLMRVADVDLLSQWYAAHRYGAGLEAYPRIQRVERLAMQHPACQRAHPDAQPDKPE